MNRHRKAAREKVLDIMAAHEDDALPALIIAQKTGLRHGRIFATLMSLEDEQIITSAWEEGSSPRRRLYRLNGPNAWKALGPDR